MIKRLPIPHLLFFLIICNNPAFGEILLSRQAESYYEAQDYEKSRELFNKLMGENLHHWQQERLYYNIGNTYLEQGEWENALNEYSNVDEFSEQSHYLSRVIATNEAIILFRRASDILHQKNAKLDDYSNAVFYLRDCLQKIKEAEEADCRQVLFLGEKKCSNSEDLHQLKVSAKRTLAIALKKYGEAKISETSVKEGVPLLLAGVKITLNHLVFLDNKQLTGSLRESYLELFAQEADSWLALWDNQITQFKELKKAHQDYLAGIQSLKENKLHESQVAFLSSEVALADLIKKLWGNDPLISLLQNLLVGYERALDQLPLQLFTLSQIESEQKQVEENAKDEIAGSNVFQKSSYFLSESIKYSKQANYDQARFFLFEAKQWLRRFIQMKTEHKNNPENVLEDAIENETHALTLQRLRHEMKKNDQQVNQSLIDSQSQTMQAASRFYIAVMQQEAHDFIFTCQCKPWDQVVPLFDKGLNAAQNAMELIEKGHRRNFTMKEQELAIKFWKEALQKLKQNKGTPPPTPSLNQNLPPPKSQESSSINDVLRQLQQMNQADRLPKSVEVKPKQGLRPW